MNIDELPIAPLGKAALSPPLIRIGIAEIDRALPWNGLPRGVHEIGTLAGDAAGVGFAAALATRGAGAVLWCRSNHCETGTPYGPGLAALGLPASRLIFVEARRPTDLLWAMEEGLRAKSLACVLGEGVTLDLTSSRRLQLAAEAGDTLALALPLRTMDSAISAVTRWFAASAPSIPDANGPGNPRWSLELRRCRGGAPQSWMVEWNDATLSLDLVASLADRPLAATG